MKKPLAAASALTGIYLIASGRATDFLPDANGPDGDVDADDHIIHAASHGHAAVYGGSVIPEAAPAILAALAALGIAAAVAVMRYRKGARRSARMIMAAGVITALAALALTPYTALRPVLPGAGLLAAALAFSTVVSLAARKLSRQYPARPARRETIAVPAASWHPEPAVSRVPAWPARQDDETRAISAP